MDPGRLRILTSDLTKQQSFTDRKKLVNPFKKVCIIRYENTEICIFVEILKNRNAMQWPKLTTR